MSYDENGQSLTRMMNRRLWTAALVLFLLGGVLTWAGAGLGTPLVILGALIFPIAMVAVVAVAFRKPVDALPRWLLIAGGVLAAAGLLGAVLVSSPSWMVLALGFGVWLLIVGVVVGLVEGVWKKQG